MFIEFHWIFIDIHGFQLNGIENHWFSMKINDSHRKSNHGTYWKSLKMSGNIGFVWSFFEQQGQCWTAFCPPLRPGGGCSTNKNQRFVWGFLENRTSLGQPSGSLRAHPQPSAPCGWVLSVGAGLPPQTPPDFLFVIYKVDGCGCCLLLSHAGGVGGFLYLYRCS